MRKPLTHTNRHSYRNRHSYSHCSCYGYSDSDCYPHSYSHCSCYSYSYSYSYGNRHSYCDSSPKVNANAKAASDTTASPVAAKMTDR